MTSASRRVFPVLAFAVLGLSAAGPVVSAESDRPAVAATALTKIAPWVIEKTSGGRQAEFIVVLEDQADLSAAAQLSGKLAKASFVRDALYAKAERSQAELLASLRAQGIAHRSFYIVNAILVTGTRAVAEAIAMRAGVARIEGNPMISSLDPVSLTPEELETAARAALAPQAIEPGVSYVRAPEVWAAGATGQGIVIGSNDTGVQWNHSALINKYRGWNGSTVDHDYNWHDSVHSGGGVCGHDAFAPCDDHGHGTHTTGTAVGSNAANTHQIGVAPGARFIACRGLSEGSGTPAQILECMEWFLAPYPVGGTPAQGDPAKAPDLTINSWGCTPGEGCEPASLLQAVEAQRAAGIMFIAAAGNFGPSCASTPFPPAFYDAAYSVGAIDAGTGNIASFSSRGPVTIDGSGRLKPDITAPGIGVLSSIPPNTYSLKSGTSMAAPHVAGAVALLWSACPSLRNQISQTEDFLDQGAVPATSTSCDGSGIPNVVYGWGRLNIKAAVDIALLSKDAPRSSTVWLGPALPNPAHGATRIRFRLSREGPIALTIFSSSGRRVRTLVRGGRAAGEHVLRWDGLDERGESTPAGVYLVKLESRGEVARQKIIWLGP